jgi:hypothetical protein
MNARASSRASSKPKIATIVEQKHEEDVDTADAPPKFSIGRFLPNIFGPSDAAKAMMAVFDTSDGRLKEIMKLLTISSAEKKSFLNMWLEIDGDRNNKMDYNEFISYFNLDDDVWSKRTFGIINYNATDVVSFVEFLHFCATYLFVDRVNTIEFTFRLLSRRGHAFNKAHHPILDLDDMKFYISSRFAIKSLSKCKKRAADIFKVMNKNGDGGVELDEFSFYCSKNMTMCAFAHSLLMHLRKCVFGLEFWVSKSRKMKLAYGSALDHLVFFNSVNSISEKFCNAMKQPVVDHKGYPLVTSNTPEAEENYDEYKPSLSWHCRFSLSRYSTLMHIPVMTD